LIDYWNEDLLHRVIKNGLLNAKMDANKDDMRAQLQANRESDREQMRAEISARMDVNTKSSKAEMRSTVCAFRSELKETIQYEMKAVMQPLRAELDETTSCKGATETELDPGMMQSIEEHQEIPKGEAAVVPVGEPRKLLRVRNLAAERPQKRKERTRRYSGSSRKSAAACRKVSRHAKVTQGRIQAVVNRGRNWPSHVER
jgi:hypothetical protein